MRSNDITEEELKDLLYGMGAWNDILYLDRIKTLWSRIQEVQSGEPMSEEEIFDFLRPQLTYTADVVKMISKIVQLLTRRQGFVVDWPKDDPKVKGFIGIFTGSETADDVFGEALKHGEFFIPRPKQKRRKTDEELLSDVFSNTGSEIGWKVIALRLAAKETPEQIAMSYGVALDI
jgi:hypothetical protein